MKKRMSVTSTDSAAMSSTTDRYHKNNPSRVVFVFGDCCTSCVRSSQDVQNTFISFLPYYDLQKSPLPHLKRTAPYCRVVITDALGIVHPRYRAPVHQSAPFSF